jgi:glycosyltransferase 2 family protein
MPRLQRYLLLLVGALAVAFFFYKFRNSIGLQGFRWEMVGHSLRHARVGLLLLGVAMIFIAFALRALRWMRFCRWIGPSHFRNVYDATMMGFTCVFLLGRAGEPVRPALIARKDSLPVGGMFGVYVLERVADIAAAVIIAILALFLFNHSGLTSAVGTSGLPVMQIARSAATALFVGLVVVIAFLVYFRSHGAAWLSRRLQNSRWRHGWRGKLVSLLEGFSEGLQGIRTWGDLSALVLYSAVHWTLISFFYFWVIRAFPGTLSTLSFSSALLVMAFSLVGSTVQLPAVGGGAQAATFLVFTLVFGVEKEPAMVASIVIWLIGSAACSLVGLPLLFREGWSMGELGRMARAEGQATLDQDLRKAENAAASSEGSR